MEKIPPPRKRPHGTRNSEESRERAPSPKSAAAAGAAMSIARCTMLRPAPAPIWYACTAVAAASSSVYRAYIAGFAEVATRSTSRNATQSNLDRDVLLRCLFARLAAAKHAARSAARTQICEISPGEQRLRGMSRATLRVQFLDASASHELAAHGALEQAGAHAHDSPSPPRRCTIPTKPKTNATAATISAVGTASA